MKTLLPLFLFLVEAHAQVNCPPEEKHKLGSHVHDAQILKLANNDKSQVKVVKIDSLPKRVTPTTVEYDVQPEMKLKPGECAYYDVPEHLRKLPVMFMILQHRQSEEDNTGYDHAKKYDNNPGLTTVQVNEANSAGESKWRYWGGSASGKWGAKFAEPRWEMEPEGLYEWYKHGHTDIKTETTSKAQLKIDGMRLCSIGTDPVSIGGLEAKFYPGKADQEIEHNFGSGNKMGDTLTASGREYGELAGSIVFGSYQSNKLPAGWKMQGTSLSIPIPAGKTLKSFEAAVSDTKSSTLSQHDDGQQTTSGWGKLTVKIKKKNGTIIPIMNRENVPPRGVIFGTPEAEVKAEAGDELIIDGTEDKIYLMGLKLGLDGK